MCTIRFNELLSSDVQIIVICINAHIYPVSTGGITGTKRRVTPELSPVEFCSWNIRDFLQMGDKLKENINVKHLSKVLHLHLKFRFAQILILQVSVEE